MAPAILFSFDDVICDTLKRRFGRWKYELNWQVIGGVESLYKRDFRIIFGTLKWPDNKIDQLEKELDDLGVNYHGVIKFNKMEDMLSWLKRNNSLFYTRDRELVKALFPNAVEWEDYLIQMWTMNERRIRVT
jgi:hypothetical protein